MFSVDYRLAPRHRFPSAANDVRSGWDWLIRDHGPAPERTIVAADYAGGHLSVDLLLQPDVIHPSALVLLSPALGPDVHAGPPANHYAEIRQSVPATLFGFSSCTARESIPAARD